MGKYIHLFDTNEEYEGVRTGESYGEPWLSYTDETERVNYNKNDYDTLLETPLTFRFLSSGYIELRTTSGWQKEYWYKRNDGEWTSIETDEELEVEEGDEVSFRAYCDTWCVAIPGKPRRSAQFVSDTDCEVFGNIMSMVNLDSNLDRFREDAGTQVFENFFSGMEIQNADELLLPAMILTESCYYGMFEGCVSLTTAPELPATVLAANCYAYMFYGCDSLVKAPSILPATELTVGCYDAMFSGCGSLYEAPELPATELAEGCYSYMFQDCELLVYIKCMAQNATSSNTGYWTEGVTAGNGVFLTSYDAEWEEGENGIPYGWHVARM